MNKSHLRRIPAGAIVFTKDTIDITDPCYNSKVWCRMNDVPIVPGTYDCYVYKTKDPKHEESMRVFAAQIVLKDEDAGTAVKNGRRWRRIGSIGVDSGMAGFFQNKPDFDDDEWSRLCSLITAEEKEWWNTDSYGFHHYASETKCDSWGFFTSSGYGDGGYDVYAVKKDGRCIAIEIRFY